MAGNISEAFTVLSNLSLSPGSGSTVSLALNGGVIYGASYISMPSASSVQFSTGTLVLGGAVVSWRTIAGDSSLASLGPTNAECMQVGFILRASGASLVFRSGNSIYNFNSAGSGAAV